MAGAVTAPLIETARLRLRGFLLSDLDEHAAILADPEVVRYVGGVPLSREEAWRKMIATPGLWAFLGYGYWAVERKSDGRMIGQLGFGDFKRDMSPSIEGLPEMGWIFAPHAHGQGYASEAAAAALAWADDALAGQEIVAIIDVNNASSINVARKAGFGEGTEADYRGETILLFRRPSRR